MLPVAGSLEADTSRSTRAGLPDLRKIMDCIALALHYLVLLCRPASKLYRILHVIPSVV